MQSTDEKLLRVFAKKVAHGFDAGDGVTFSVAIDDPDRGTYRVHSKAFYDAPMAGFADYLTRTVLSGLDQQEAARAVALFSERAA